VNIALIPARSGSKRLPDKNTKLLRGIPLLAYSINAALESRMFEEIIVSTDSEEIAEVARSWGAKAPLLRPRELSTDTSTDAEWVFHAIHNLVSLPTDGIDYVSILRPTSPLRKSLTIINAIERLDINKWADSTRAMESVSQHPGKMWSVDENFMATPYLDQSCEVIPTFNRPLQTLEKLWIQNASLEVARLSSMMKHRTISGASVLAFEMPGYEGLDINTPADWEFLEHLLLKNPDLLPYLNK
jgi:CMP-N,N'-diacetyllegionaminic acid synthase